MREDELIACQIHDGLVQDITGALLQVDAMRVQNPAAKSLETLAGILRRAVAEGRRIMNGIRTPVLDELGVIAAVEQLIEEEDRAHVQVEFMKRMKRWAEWTPKLKRPFIALRRKH